MLIPFFFACDDPSQLGILVDGKDQNIQVRDTTISLPVSTILIDSLRTDQYPITLVGHTEGDSVYGSVTAIGYLQYEPQGGKVPGDSLEFESSYIIFDINDIRSEGVLADEHWDFHEALDTLYDGAVYLSNKDLPYNTDPVFGYDFNIDPDQDTLMQIPFDQIGQQLYDQLVKAGVDTVFRDSLTRRQLYYPPLVIVPSAGNQGIFSLNHSTDTTGIYIKMRDPKTDIFYYYKYRFNSKGHYSRIIRDRSGSKLASLNQEYIDEVEGGYTYLSMINGVYPKIDLAPLQKFVDEFPSIIINDSKLNLSSIDYADDDFISPNQNVWLLYLRGGRINGPGTITSGELYFNGILSDNSYQSSSAQQKLLALTYTTSSPNYTGSTTLFTQLFADASSNYARNTIIVINPVPTSLKQTTFTEAKFTFYYTILE